MADEKGVTKSTRRFSQRRYNTRQSSGRHGRHGGSRRQSGVFSAPEIPRPPTPAPDEPVPSPDISQPGDKLVSRLFESTVRFWTLILKEEDWPLRLAPGGITPALPSPGKSPPFATDGESNIVDGTMSSDSEAPEPSDEPNSPESADRQEVRTTTPTIDQGRNWKELVLANLVLQEELSRLRLWKITFTDDDLDLLSKTRHEIVHATLKCLVNVSNTLIEEYAGPLNPPRKQLDDEEDVLTELAKQVGGLIEQVPYDDDVMTTEGDCSETHGSNTTAGGQTFLKNLTENIDRLHRLSHSMCLVLDDIKGRFT
ncbi:hypothetical protein EDB80DRAFT_838623 [Ilyonectria destructans]|nr:hypothetical protein EDB80DRAFT_838623 [Ilyonectria destructans]